eukprot:CAMPEP_0198520508 /NCGR_PEP_ID=MMETSP1462-20131121/20373_1 /TAXON_ID=1333877 /ORGANISM="Brandtodinium nutriculum, Strain RCC3387" /LENGTH=53 /DNA_ID=CAMNT_0044250139 /DNA_START=35 /DNA_END=192 /DNA_ORIENTATION=+
MPRAPAPSARAPLGPGSLLLRPRADAALGEALAPRGSKHDPLRALARRLDALR